LHVIHAAARRPQTKGGAGKTNESFFAARLIEHLAIPAFVLDAQGWVLIWNRACERLTGVPAGEVMGGRNHWKAFYDRERPTLADLVIADRLAEAAALYEASSDPGVDPHGFSAETWCAMPRAGGQLYLAIDVGPIFDERGHLVAVVETLRDLTAKKQKEAELLELAQCDTLTSIANRRTFDRRLEEEWTRAERSRTPVSLLLIDVDRFKHCNASYGHAAGDRCLRHVAEAIRGETRHAGDLAARIGGDEFAAILPNTPIEAAMAVAERIRLAIFRARLLVARPPSRARLTVSIGVAESLKFRSCEAFLAAADATLYRAKGSGRNRTVAASDPCADVAASLTRIALGQPPA
jgi:diguanylate cyclase (GGDEF)-like protein/PAS domain S-box-containing protein